eukprot:COSAG01_NODE_1581_length_9827_cov_12.794613_4_plen_106_part_00
MQRRVQGSLYEYCVPHIYGLYSCTQPESQVRFQTLKPRTAGACMWRTCMCGETARERESILAPAVGPEVLRATTVPTRTPYTVWYVAGRGDEAGVGSAPTAVQLY